MLKSTALHWGGGLREKTKWLRKNFISTVKAIEASGARALFQFNVSTIASPYHALEGIELGK